jgi:hypothetical protein
VCLLDFLASQAAHTQFSADCPSSSKVPWIIRTCFVCETQTGIPPASARLARSRSDPGAPGLNATKFRFTTRIPDPKTPRTSVGSLFDTWRPDRNDNRVGIGCFMNTHQDRFYSSGTIHPSHLAEVVPEPGMSPKATHR